MANTVLALNAGSSSIKFALAEIRESRDASAPRRIVAGAIDGIGIAPRLTVRDGAGNPLAERRWPTARQPAHDALLDTLLGWLEAHLGENVLVAVGHRVVHGGHDFISPVRVTLKILETLTALTPLAPLHQPHNLAPIRTMLTLRPNLPQVACFDTAFHHTQPVVATRFALPRDYENEGVRRYGFHGLSYEYIAGQLAKLSPALSRGRVIVAHLGNGASLCAMRDGQSIDTTMGFTTLDGLMMGTRCGTLDAGVPLYMGRWKRLSVEQIEHVLYNESGLLGVSGISSDMRDLLASPDPRAKEAIELFVYRIGREAAALAGSLGGLDGFVFTAGIGEHAAEIRAAICERLSWLGVVLDAAANQRNAQCISAPASRVTVLVIPTDEEAMIQQHALANIASDPH